MSQEDKAPVSKKELKAWYLYDWAHSGFPSAAGVLWIPILLDVLAERHACPYVKEPQVSPVTPLSSSPPSNVLLTNPCSDSLM